MAIAFDAETKPLTSVQRIISRESITDVQVPHCPPGRPHRSQLDVLCLQRFPQGPQVFEVRKLEARQFEAWELQEVRQLEARQLEEVRKLQTR
jgi:hypothetical protein